MFTKFISLIIVYSFIVLHGIFNTNNNKNHKNSFVEKSNIYNHNIQHFYDSLQLNIVGLNKSVFELAIVGYNQLATQRKITNTNTIAIVDFDMPSNTKRLFVVDLMHRKLLFNTYVAHGKNSGLQTANNFSNAPESNKSSLGFYATQNTYLGKHGYSLQLNGLEKGFNDNAMSRGIVVHAAAYVNETIAQQQGYIGRSLGCPAIPEKMHTNIINAIANGACFFIYANNYNYLHHSTFLSRNS